jgi:hypothetical protein
MTMPNNVKSTFDLQVTAMVQSIPDRSGLVGTGFGQCV